MTVGISFSHGDVLEAIVIADSRASSKGILNRQSDSFNKIGEFSSEKYHGVIFGSGLFDLMDTVITNIDNIITSDLDDYVSKVHAIHKGASDHLDQNYFDSQRSEIMKKASTLLPISQLDNIKKNAEQVSEAQRDQFIQQQLENAQEKYNKFVEGQMQIATQQGYHQFKQQNEANFVLVALDKEKQKIRKFNIYQSGYTEIFKDHLEIGSGVDGANMYLAVNLQGIAKDAKLSTADLLFFGLNAYNSATITPGVGGTPSIEIVKEDKVTPLPTEQVTTLVNLSSAYLSRFAEDELTHAKTRQLIGEVINGKEDTYDKIADTLKLNVEALQTTTIPYSAWQERSNQQLFTSPKTI